MLKNSSSKFNTNVKYKVDQFLIWFESVTEVHDKANDGIHRTELKPGVISRAF